MVEYTLDESELDDALGHVMGELDRFLPEAVSKGSDKVAEDMQLTDAFKDVSGVLRNSIMDAGTTGTFSGEDLQGAVGFGAVSDEGYPYGIAINDGSRPHTIRARRRKRLRIPVADGFVFPKEVQHPGTEATHFADDALEGRIPYVVDQLERAAGRAFRKAGFFR